MQRIANGMRDAGLDVWWDQDIAPGAPWEATIERQLSAAKVVVVAWSQAAVASENVKAEARRARNAGKLIQVFVEPCEPPLFFGERQGVDLSNWNGAASDNRFQAVLAAVRAIMDGKRPPEGVGYTPRKHARWGMLTALFVGVSAALGFVSNLGGARDAVCGLEAASGLCSKLGLVRTEAAATDPMQVRAHLLQSVAGTWGRQDSDCGDVISYSIERAENGPEFIVARAADFESSSQVLAAENGVIVARTTEPSQTGAREQWEFRPDGDRLTIYDRDGIATTLVRCEASD